MQFNIFKRKERNEIRKLVQHLRLICKNELINKTFEYNADIDIGEPNNIIAAIIKASGTDMETMIDNFITFFIMGKKTANSVAFSFLELGKNRAVLEK